MDASEENKAGLGDEPPLTGDGRSGPPDRREISARWLLGTFLTGVTSSILMGVALSAALDGREQLATPPEIAKLVEPAHESGEAAKTSRLVPPRTIAKETDRKRMEVSTVMKSGDRDVVRTMPFVHVSMSLAAPHATTKDYPPFDPLAVFAEDGAVQTARTGLIYGAKVESEVSLRTSDFPFSSAMFEEKGGLSADEVERVVRNTGAILTEGDVQVASLHYVDPQRFGDTLSTQALSAAYGVRIVQENVSVAPRDMPGEAETEFAEDIIAFNADKSIDEAFVQSGYESQNAADMADAISKILNTTALKAGTVLRLGLVTSDEETRVVRTSVYDEKQHIVTIALNDREQFVPAEEPELNPEILAAFENRPQPIRTRGELPRAYDGLYRAAYSYGLTPTMTRQLIRLLASDIDFQSRLNPSDRLEVFFSQPGPDDKATDQSELLYVSATFGGNTRNFYRFQLEDGTVDYFDSEGRSARAFLLRKPVPNGVFKSGFGGRRHPILGYVRMHTGVDWAAPRGTPIIASGNGVVEKAGWTGGYGRQTIIRHANGYETSYNHQSAIANGIRPGVRVRQGQVIGYVGSTGLATGPHLHYELIVNGRKVDPMRVRLPDSRTLEGAELEAFLRERDRIDTLLKERGQGQMTVASRN
ncbi:murein DD-endopeptidase MepM/ murein hydrolase activator NlpD [Mesorhizobium sp. J18]|uniref:M23 family metallopeptidase n=1 Tax=Mesorhizobium sp. J18 TaxID=935263 RepID=UPI00119C4745|nr:M23 family metallopeptidase [Mesorhizobium sp. J18]TWG90264.1 murein DD-endopeptidase MepM/ murein hydrolase activator NlpD [Mesorhizobium sp. J18]